MLARFHIKQNRIPFLSTTSQAPFVAKLRLGRRSPSPPTSQLPPLLPRLPHVAEPRPTRADDSPPPARVYPRAPADHEAARLSPQQRPTMPGGSLPTSPFPTPAP